MAKKQHIRPASPAPQAEQPIVQAPVQQPAFDPKSLRSWLYEFKGQAIIVALLAFIIYCNSFSNEFAHDDGIVIVKNEYVLEGFKGIPSIMTKDAYDSYYRQLNTTNQLSGGRYRPLSIVTFAIEQQFLGAVDPEHVDSVLKQTISYGVTGPSQQKLVNNMHVRHVVNVLFYMLSVVVLLYFLRYIVFRNDPIAALLAAVIFTVHPIHTEVVANVKSRDEIMSLLFMCLTFIFAFRYEEEKTKTKWLWIGMLCYFLAFLSKEYAITMIALLPLGLYIFRGYSIPKSIMAVLPYLVVVTLYMGVRLYAMAPALNDDVEASTNMIIVLFPKLAIVAGGVAMYLFIKPRKDKEQKTEQQLLMKNIVLFIPYFILAGAYLYVRVHAIPPVVASAEKEVLNNPYLFAVGSQKIATEIASSLTYVRMLVFPTPLSADYSYAQIPYKDFAHPLVWLSIVVHLGLLALMLYYFKKRHLLSFALAFYFLHLILVCNVIFDIGATLGERLIYHSSVGFAIAIAYLMVKGAEKIQPVATAQKALAGLMIVIVGLLGFKTIDRNKAWKNDATLFTTDIKTVPNSVLVNANVAASYITIADFQTTEAGKQKYLHDAIDILNHTLSIHRTFVAGFLNRGIAWYKLGDIDRAKANIDTVRSLYPTYPTLPGMYKLICDFYLKNGWEKYGKYGKYAEAVEEYKKGLSVDPNSVDLWYNMGGAYYTNRQFPEAVDAFQHALKADPHNAQAQNGLNAALQGLNGVPQSQRPK